MSLEDMDKSGIGTAVLSQVQPGTWWGDNEESRKLSRQINEYGAILVRELNRRKAMISVHPLAPNCCGDVVPGIYAGLDGICDRLDAHHRPSGFQRHVAEVSRH